MKTEPGAPVSAVADPVKDHAHTLAEEPHAEGPEE